MVSICHWRLPGRNQYGIKYGLTWAWPTSRSVHILQGRLISLGIECQMWIIGRVLCLNHGWKTRRNYRKRYWNGSAHWEWHRSCRHLLGTFLLSWNKYVLRLRFILWANGVDMTTDTEAISLTLKILSILKYRDDSLRRRLKFTVRTISMALTLSMKWILRTGTKSSFQMCRKRYTNPLNL